MTALLDNPKMDPLPGTDSHATTLRINKLEARYGESVVLRDVNIHVPDGKLVSLMGRNGVGKTTTLKSIMGILPQSSGEISFAGKSWRREAPEDRARAGMGYVPQGRDIFPNMTVGENLQLCVTIYGKKARDRMEFVLDLFPVLRDMLKRKGGVLSGGQQQQLAIGRALLTCPKLLILDEPTEGIQPSIIDLIEDALLRLKREMGISILLVEQYLDFVAAVSDYVYIMDRGTIIAEGKASILADPSITKHLSV
ncbi:MAG: urea transporter, ATP-binding protein UrtE [Verrucomicrobiaceae bacterium]|nr:urea transporter, ATP-binding protein UrtE [Verrucomicrobiaceae bacterium]MDB6120139.1 urea transporter, ATP-binding protein UrtE [Verrucomicrobiaceae bacterium]